MKFKGTIIGMMLGAFFIAPQAVHAADLFFEPIEGPEGPGFTVSVRVLFDEPINALEGVLIFDPGVLSVRRVNPSPVGVPLWIQPPAVTEPGELSFAGIFPGGIGARFTDRVSLFEVTFEGLSDERTTLSFRDVRVFLHGPDAQEDVVRSIPIIAIIEPEDLGEPEIVEDTIPPQPFRISVFSGDLIEGKKAVAFFLARDLQSGVAKYEIRLRLFGVFGDWEETLSPSLLSSRWPWSIIDVRATDHAGNTRVARHVPTVLIVTYVLLGIIVVLIFGLWMWRIRWLRRKAF